MAELDVEMININKVGYALCDVLGLQHQPCVCISSHVPCTPLHTTPQTQALEAKDSQLQTYKESFSQMQEQYDVVKADLDAARAQVCNEYALVVNTMQREHRHFFIFSSRCSKARCPHLPLLLDSHVPFIPPVPFVTMYQTLAARRNYRRCRPGHS